MTKISNLLTELVLPFLFVWFFTTILVDIIVIPNVFRTLGDIHSAGKIGMVVFHKFNLFEIFFGLMILSGIALKPLRKLWELITSIILFFLSLIYTFVMTPAITEITQKINQTNITDPVYAELQTNHAFYHNFYRYLDSAKLIVLLIFIIATLVLKLRITKEEGV
jgi:hypothetical protein